MENMRAILKFLQADGQTLLDNAHANTDPPTLYDHRFLLQLLMSWLLCLLNKIFLSSEPFWHHASHGSYIFTWPHLFLSRTGEPCRHSFSNYPRPSPLPSAIDINPFCFMGTFLLFKNIESTYTIFTWWDSPIRVAVKWVCPYQNEPHNLTHLQFLLR